MSVKMVQQAILGCDGCGATIAGDPEKLSETQSPVRVYGVAGVPAPQASWMRLVLAPIVVTPFSRTRTKDLCPTCHRRVEAALSTAFQQGAPLQ